MVYFQTKNRNLGTFRRALQSKMLVCIMDIWSILNPFDIFYGHLDYLVVICLKFFTVLVYCTWKNLATPVKVNVM
jgi:hypothetical protein